MGLKPLADSPVGPEDRPSGRSVFYRAVSACVELGGMDVGERIFEALHAKGVVLSTEVYAAFCSRCVGGREAYRAVRTVLAMSKLAQRPAVEACGDLVASLEAEGRFGMAYDVLREMRIAGIEPDARIHRSVLATAVKHATWREVVEIMDHIEDQGGDLQSGALCELMRNCLGKRGNGNPRTRWNASLLLLRRSGIQD